MLVIPAHGRWKQVCHKFRAAFGYVASLSYKRPCFKQNKTENQTKAVLAEYVTAWQRIVIMHRS